MCSETNALGVQEIKVKPGYKMTELGVIPEDWDIKNLGDLCSYINDGTHHTPTYVSSGIPFYSVENVTGNEFVNVKYVTQEAHDEMIRRCKPEKNDILLTRIGSLGQTKLIDWDINASIYVSLALLKINNKIDVNYLYRFTKGNIFIEELLKRSLINATPQKINMGDIKNIPIIIPNNTQEQKLIAQTLSDTDELINSLDELIEKKEKIKEGTMQELLTGKRRLPGFDGEWEEKKLEKTFTNITTGKLDANAMVKNGKFRFYTCAKEHYYIDNYIYDEEVLLISGNGENVGYVHYFNGKFNAYQRTYILLGFKDYIFFIKYYLDKYLKDRIFVEAKLGSTPYITKDTLTDMIVNVPTDIEEQKAIAKVLSDMDNEIEALKSKRDKYKQIKEGMMQELLTGKTRLV